MSAYLVRLETSHELVGMFVAESYEHLANVVDECCDPNSCEAVMLSKGGIFWSKNRGVPKVPGTKSIFSAEATISDYSLEDASTKRWKSLDGLYRL